VAVQPTREVAAVVVARNESRIAAEVGGVVLRWGADSGARVRRGDLLAEIDATDHRLARDRAKAALEASQARAALAKAQLQRARDLVAQGFFSREALSERETEVALGEADLAAQRLALASAERAVLKARVVAPFDASVAQRLVQTGETVAPGAQLYVLVQTSGAELSARLAPEDADSLRQASEPRFVRPDGSATPLKLLRVAGTLSSPARTVEVRLAGSELVPGRDGRLVWSDPRPHVPAALLVRRKGKIGVFSVVDGKARFVALALGQEGRATPAELPPQTVLVTEGHQALREGDPVGTR
jgi:RND family efflux transporter MFP subunit